MVIRPRPGPATEENLNQAIPGIMIKKGRRYTNGRLLRGQPGTGDDHFVCPLCGRKAHIKRLKGEIYNTGEIECRCGYSFHF